MAFDFYDAPYLVTALEIYHPMEYYEPKFLAGFRRIRNILKTDLRFRAFHQGRSAALPGYSRRVYERELGK